MEKSNLAGSANDTGLVENALLLGIDMGTSRSSIVSMRGARKTVASYVGWPRDAVSRKLFATDVVSYTESTASSPRTTGGKPGAFIR